MNLREIYQKYRPAMGQEGQAGPDHLHECHDSVEIDGSVQAVKIWSRILHDEIWLILAPSFVLVDGLACYYAEELPLLKGKTEDQLKEIHKTKLAFPGCRVIQEGPEPRKERC
jgi:hypothetical protein